MKRWRRFRLRGRLLVVGVAVLAVLAVGAWLGQRLLDLGRRDLRLIEAAGDLESVVTQMRLEAGQYLSVAPHDFPAYFRDTQIYFAQLQRQLAQVRRSEGELLGLAGAGGRDWLSRLLDRSGEPLPAATARLDRTLRAFQAGLQERLGADPAQPRLEWGAGFIEREGEAFQNEVAAISTAVRAQADRHLAIAQWAGRRGDFLAFGIAAAGVLWLVATVMRRVRGTLDGAQRIARGHFGHRIQSSAEDELSALDEGINKMSMRMAAVLGLLDRIQRGRELDQTLLDVHAALAPAAGLDWLALYEHEGEESCVELRGQQPHPIALPLPRHADLACPESEVRVRCLLPATDAGADPVGQALAGHGFSAAVWVLIPMSHARCFALLLASRRAGAFAPDLVELLGNIAPIIAQGLDKTLLAERLLLATVDGLSKLAESRDNETGDHLLRMSEYSRILAETYAPIAAEDEVPLGEDFARDIHRFAPMHDIGKVGIPDSILLKPGPLTESERAEMNRHTLIGGEVLRACAMQLSGSGKALFEIAIAIAEGHHERFDGSGYPRGLSGKAIPLAARIVAIADVFDALTSRRPYKPAWPLDRALGYLREQAGRQFDADLVEAFTAAWPRMEAVYRRYRHV